MQVKMFRLAAQNNKKINHVKYLQGYNAINSFLLGFRVKERIAAHLFTLYAIVKYKVNKIKGVIFSFLKLSLKKDINKMTLSLNPSVIQDKEKNTEIQVNNIDLVTQHKPMPQQEAPNTADLNTQELTQAQQTQDFAYANDLEYIEFTKQKLEAKKAGQNLKDSSKLEDEIDKSIAKGMHIAKKQPR